MHERLAMFFREVDLAPADLAGMQILDAGCGHGELASALGPYAGSVVGFDLAATVEGLQSSQPNVTFVRGDLNDPPFKPESFDLVYSGGVLHHNKSTEAAFRSAAHLVRPGGRFYVWLYRIAWKPIPIATLAANEPIRWIVSRLPSRAQAIAAHIHATVYHAILSVLRPGKYTYAEHLIAAYDATAPRYAHRHTPFELARWFHEAGFDSPFFTHWDNDAGFGMVAVKREAGSPAGVRFSADRASGLLRPSIPSVQPSAEEEIR